MVVNVGDGLLRLMVALLVGLLIGLDRERSEERKPHGSFAGVRTFALIALAGCLASLVDRPAGPILLAGGFVTIGAIALISYRREAAIGEVGATTEIAAIVTFILGAVAGSGGLLFAGAAGIVVAVLLVSKSPLEGFSRALEPAEITAVLQLAVITVIILPVLPDRAMGPWDVFNPRSIWLVVVMVSGLSLAAFLAVRVLGQRKGLAVTGAIGSLVSSTAVTVAMADHSKQTPDMSTAAASATAIASTVMALRVGALAGIVDAGLLPRLAPPLIAMVLVGVVASWLIARRRDAAGTPAADLRNPFRLQQALLFAAIYAVILLMVRAAREYLAPGAIFGVAALSAVVDVDAITIASAQQGAGTDEWRTVTAAITVAAVVNTIMKLVYGAVRGGPEFRRLTAGALGAMAAAGAVTGVIVYLR